MVEITVAGDSLHLEVLGWSKLWAFKSYLEVPLRCVKSARTADGPLPRGYPVRWPGTAIPKLIIAGSYTDWSFKRWAFVDVRYNRENVLVIELAGWKYELLVVAVRDARVTLEMINKALAALPRAEPAPSA